MVVEAFSTNPLVNKGFLYICTFKQLNAGVYKVSYSRDKGAGKKIHIFQVRKKNQNFCGKITQKPGFFGRFLEIFAIFEKSGIKMQ